MGNNTEQPCKTPLEDLRNEALRHYEEASSAIHHWSSFVENAIKTYNPESGQQTTSDVKQAAKEMACKFMAWYVDDPNEEVTKALMELPVDNLIEDVYDYWLIKYFNPETIVSTVPNKTNKND